MRTNQELFDLTGQVAIVTGGAYGLGLQLAYALGEAGANLVIASRKLDKCQETAAKIEKELGVKCVAARLDLTKPDEINDLFELVKQEFAKVDILVNNSGLALVDSMFKFPLESWHQVMDTNLTGLWLMCQKAGAMMVKQNYGRIINVSSCTGMVGVASEFILSPPYSASKGAVISLSRDLAVKWAKKNVTVNCLVPGWFGSDMGEINKPAHDKINEYYIPTLKNGELESRIKPTITPGGIVTIHRSLVNTLVTEYGMVRVKGLSTWQRAEALIGIAHPKFRDDLVKEAHDLKIWRNSNKIS